MLQSATAYLLPKLYTTQRKEKETFFYEVLTQHKVQKTT